LVCGSVYGFAGVLVSRPIIHNCFLIIVMCKLSETPNQSVSLFISGSKAHRQHNSTHIRTYKHTVTTDLTRVFGARGRSNEVLPQSRDVGFFVGITLTVRFSVKDILWLPELSLFCKVTTTKFTAKLHKRY